LKKTFLFFLIAVLAVLVFPVNVLSIHDDDTSYITRLGTVRVTIEYNHSVEHSEVIEVLTVNSSGMYVRKMLWSDFGAGLPEDIQGMEDGMYYKDVDQYIGKSLDYWFIPFNRAKVIVNGRLVAAPKHAELVRFRIRRCPLIMVLLRRC